MTLAHILLIGLLSATPRQTPSASASGTTQSQAPQQQNSPAQPVQNPAGTPASNSAQTTSGQATPETKSQRAGKTANARKRSKSPKNSSGNCDSANAKGKPASGATSSNTSASAAKTASNCPPIKVIVTQGSTTEPSIEVAGGASGAQASNERNTAIQMLETTEANLKKVEAGQPDSNQQEMIKQVRQFIDQSKAANSAGNLDQAKTLAWKAQLLSEELLKPPK
jgi:hypothetical protein